MSTLDATFSSQSRVSQVLIGTIVPTVIGSFFVIAKLYTRIVITRSWGSDDTLLTLGWILSLTLAIQNCLLTTLGTGHHTELQSNNEIISTLKIAFASRLIYQLTLSIIKLGICIFYMRIFQDKKSKRLIWGMMGFVIISTIPVELVVVFQCNPVDGAWELTGVAKCIKLRPEIITFAVCNVLGDAGLIGFVVPRVLPLKMARRQKMSLLAVVSLGVLAIIAAIVRLVRVLALDSGTDVAWNGYDVTTWSSVELNTALFCSAAPCLRPLLRKIAPGFMSSISGTYSGPSRPTLPFSKSRNNTHLSTHKTRPYRNAEAFELGSSNGFGFQDGKGQREGGVMNTFWVGEGSRKSLEDDDSERAVLGDGRLRTVEGEIVKTVSIVVHDHDRGEDVMSGSVGTRKFEHV